MLLGTKWVEQHWMTMNGKRKGHNRNDIYAVADLHLLKIRRIEIDEIIDKVIHSVSLWDSLAEEHGVPVKLRKHISELHLLDNFAR